MEGKTFKIGDEEIGPVPLANQQGDVLFFPEKELPANAVRARNNHVAEGEATGHYHELVGEGVEVFDVPKGGGVIEKWARVPHGGTVIRHQEHKPQTIDTEVPEVGGKADLFRIGIVREFDHAAMEARRVID